MYLFKELKNIITFLAMHITIYIDVRVINIDLSQTDNLSEMQQKNSTSNKLQRF